MTIFSFDFCIYQIIFQLYKVPEEAVGYNAGGEDWLGCQRIGGEVTFLNLAGALEIAITNLIFVEYATDMSLEN